MSDKYQAYPEYKESGVEWLGVVPENWSRAAVWMKFSLGRGRVISNEEIADNQGIYPVYSSQTLDDGVMGYIDSFDFEGEYITWTTDGANAGTVFARKGKFNCTNVCGTLKAHKSEESFYRYYAYALSVATSWFVRHDINPKLMNNVMSAIRIPAPSIEEQHTIAAFLDYETARIDQLIAKQQRLIELLKEKRQAVISHAVTKGLNPNVPMKDSGVEWLGQVPEHWVVTKAKYVSQVFIPQRNKPELNESQGYPWVTMEDMTNQYIVNPSRFVSSEAMKLAGSRLLPSGSVIASCVGNLGVASINTQDVIINQQLQAFIPISIKAEYLKHIVRVSKPYFELIGTAATLVYVNQEGFENMPMLVPSAEEQEKICHFVFDKDIKFMTLIAKAEHKVKLLLERRTALISAAVTGKIDLRGWNPPNERNSV